MGLDSSFYAEIGYFRNCHTLNTAILSIAGMGYDGSHYVITKERLKMLDDYMKSEYGWCNPRAEKWHYKEWKKVRKRIKRCIKKGIDVTYEASW